MNFKSLRDSASKWVRLTALRQLWPHGSELIHQAQLAYDYRDFSVIVREAVRRGNALFWRGSARDFATDMLDVLGPKDASEVARIVLARTKG